VRFLQSSWFPVLLGLVIAGVIAGKLIQGSSLVAAIHSAPAFDENALWQPPDTNDIPNDETGDRIRYGRDLIQQTSFYLGPKGIVASMSNGMNCQNCHLDAGQRNFANPFCAACANYPKYRDRSGRVESIEFRVNECMERSLDGKALDSLSGEMRAMVAYIRWVGEGVPKGIRPKGAAIEELPYLNRPADPQKGRAVYLQLCQSCHGAEGQGTVSADSFSYTYPPLWGPHSYASSAGMYRLSRLAGFIKNNMPLGTTRSNPKLSNEEAWDVAAYVNSNDRPQKSFAYDWPDVSKKPVDYPFGPFADAFSERQHKYGPFEPMMKRKGQLK
jgi:thiosulfate dehydrogenase